MSDHAYIHVPLVPPSVNAYTRHGNGRHYKSAEANAFENAFPLFVRGQHVIGKSFYVFVGVTLGAKDKLDADNAPKMVLDALADCAVFRDSKGRTLSDAHVTHLEVRVDRKARPEHGYTEVTVRSI